jgi:hypothetical protein
MQICTLGDLSTHWPLRSTGLGFKALEDKQPSLGYQIKRFLSAAPQVLPEEL